MNITTQPLLEVVRYIPMSSLDDADVGMLFSSPPFEELLSSVVEGGVVSLSFFFTFLLTTSHLPSVSSPANSSATGVLSSDSALLAASLISLLRCLANFRWISRPDCVEPVVRSTSLRPAKRLAVDMFLKVEVSKVHPEAF